MGRDYIVARTPDNGPTGGPRGSIGGQAATGYLHPGYAESLAEFGTPRELPYSGGWLLERVIPRCEARDAMGCYPVFTCRHWDRLHADLAELFGHLVTVALVPDPLANVDKTYLDGCFDLVRPFKCHYITDLTTPFQDSVNEHHRYCTRRSRQDVEVEICEEPCRYAREWISLYGNLIQTHNVRGLRAFSPECLRKQLSIPGMVLIVGKQREEVLGAHLVAIHDNVAYSHLAVFSAVGYEARAAYGIYWRTLEYLTSRKVDSFDLGGAAGLADTPTGGLSRFKRGWSNTTRIFYPCGRVLDAESCAQICRRMGVGHTEYFPAYRAGEFSSSSQTRPPAVRRGADPSVRSEGRLSFQAGRVRQKGKPGRYMNGSSVPRLVVLRVNGVKPWLRRPVPRPDHFEVKELYDRADSI